MSRNPAYSSVDITAAVSITQQEGSVLLCTHDVDHRCRLVLTLFS